MLNQLGAEIYGYSIGEPEDDRHIYHSLKIKAQLENGNSAFGDVRDLDRLTKEIKAANPDFLFHLAAQAIVSTSYTEPHPTFTSNILGVLNVLEFLRIQSPDLTCVIITSDKCYKNKEQIRPYSEGDEMGGDDPYSASKGAAELVFHSYAVSYPDLGASRGLATVRAGNVFGGGDWSRDRLIPDCARKAFADFDIEIRMPDAVRPWTFVVDILFGYLQLAALLRNDSKRFRGSWNFASGETKTVSEVVSAFINAVGRGQMVVNEASAVGKESSLLLIDPNKAQKALGWAPKFSVSKAIGHTAEWYRVQSEEGDILEHTRTFLAKWYFGE